MNLSTTTQLLLLQQKVAGLEGYMAWIIGGVTLTITVLMAIFAVIQFVYQRKIAQSEIDGVEKKLSAQIIKELSDKEKDLKNFAKDTVKEVEKHLEQKVSLMKADISRRFAIDCEETIPATAFDWWLDAAVGYAENNKERMASVSIKAAKESLEKIGTKFQVDSLIENSQSIGSNLIKLKNASYNIEADMLQEIFKDKLKLKPDENTVMPALKSLR
jgi:hypothetical protein